MREALLFSLSLMGKVGFAVAMPLVALGLLGRYIDIKYFPNHHNFTIIGLALAVIITYFYMRRVIKRAIEVAGKL